MKYRMPVSLSSDEAMSIAMDAYVYGYPLVLMDLTREAMTATAKPGGRTAPINQFLHLREFPDPTDTTVLSPNVDTLYSTAWVDLAKEPIVLSVPAMTRYYLIQMIDAWTNVFSSVGARTSGNGKGDFALVGPDWFGKVPEGLKAIYSPTRFVWLIGRTQTSGREDLAAGRAIQDQYRLTPLSAWGSEYAPPNGSVRRDADIMMPPVERIARMDSSTFFARLNILMKDNPPSRSDMGVLGKSSAIGIAPGMPFDKYYFGPAVAAGLDKSVPAAHARIMLEMKRPRGANVNGWTILPANTANFGTDYNWRAAAAMHGLGANLPEDILYAHAYVDFSGSPLSGRNQYTIRFREDQLPPVNAFWSITAYNEKQFLVPNPIGRYAIGDRDELRYSPDGSVTIQIRSTPPDKPAESNWLPVPSDAFNLFGRMYWPRSAAMNGMWKIPGIEKVRA